MTGDADHLAAIGRALYGDHWQSPLAAALDINRETIRRWLNGAMPFGPAHPVWRDVRALLEARAETAQALIAVLPDMPS